MGINFVNDIPTASQSSVQYYDETLPVTTDIGVSGTGYNAAHTEFTLPNSETYNGNIDQLKVLINKIPQTEGDGFTYDASSVATKITTSVPLKNGAEVRFVKVY